MHSCDVKNHTVIRVIGVISGRGGVISGKSKDDRGIIDMVLMWRGRGHLLEVIQSTTSMAEDLK